MTLLPPRISDALWRLVPAPLQARLRTTFVKRFVRFAPAAICAVAATQITLAICLGPAGLTAGISGAAAWLAGACVSYLISRWAWERKGRPDFLRETLPFVAVSICAGVILTLASKLGYHEATKMGLTGASKVIVTEIFFFVANCLTFVLRFLIFHYVLFKDRSSTEALAVVEGRAPLPPEADKHAAPVQPQEQPDPARFAEAMGSARVNGMSAWANGSAGPPAAARNGDADGSPAPERGTRRLARPPLS
jgi:putative flippase GtrA